MRNYDADLKMIADHYGLKAQLEKTEEEVDELRMALSDYRHALKSGNDFMLEECRRDLVEEMADVDIMCVQLIYLTHTEDAIDAETEYKIERQIRRIEEDNGNVD